VVFGYARALGLQSGAAEGAGKLDTQWFRYHAGVRARARFGGEESPIAGLAVCYGEDSFAFSAPANAPPLPTVDYKFARASGDIRVPFGRFAALASAGYLFVLSSGELDTRFPKASAGGVEAELGGAFTIVPGLEARLTADYRRFFFTMHPNPGAVYVAGGALDQFGSANAEVAYVY
jgi:hypothetical protein